MSAMSEYATFMEKAAELNEKLSNAKSDMSSAQMSRFVKLQAKLTAGNDVINITCVYKLKEPSYNSLTLFV